MMIFHDEQRLRDADLSELSIVEVSSEKERVIFILNTIARTFPEMWRTVRRKPKSDRYRGRACYLIDEGSHDANEA
jgi:hypothetical protein